MKDFNLSEKSGKFHPPPPIFTSGSAIPPLYAKEMGLAFVNLDTAQLVYHRRHSLQKLKISELLEHGSFAMLTHFLLLHGLKYD